MAGALPFHLVEGKTVHINTEKVGVWKKKEEPGYQEATRPGEKDQLKLPSPSKEANLISNHPMYSRRGCRLLLENPSVSLIPKILSDVCRHGRCMKIVMQDLASD